MPSEEGEVLYTHVVPTKRAGGEFGVGDMAVALNGWHWVALVSPVGSSNATPEVPQVTYAELPGLRWQQRDSSDIYENML